MRRPQGYATIVDPANPTVEFDTFTCCHCNSVVFVRPKADATEMGGFCTMCMKHTCKVCADQGCTPFEKKLEALERRDRLLRAIVGS